MQSFFIGVGAVVASMLPWLLERGGVSNHAVATLTGAGIPDTVRYAFEIGAVVLLLAIGWTVLRSREYPPRELLSFDDAVPLTAGAAERRTRPAARAAQGSRLESRRRPRPGARWPRWQLDQAAVPAMCRRTAWGVAQWLHGRGVPAGHLRHHHG